MQRLFGYMVLVSLALWWAVSVGMNAEAAAWASEDLQPDFSSIVRIDEQQHADFFRLIHQTLQSDSLPAAYAQAGGRIVLPVVRLNPSYKLLSETLSRVSEPTHVCLQRSAVQQTSEARFRAARDESGYYVFALRKIII